MVRPHRSSVGSSGGGSVLEGLVLRNVGNHYVVLCDDGVERTCLAKGNLRLRGFRSTSPIVVGDRVEVLLTSEAEGEAHFVREILPRRNFIVRRAANLSKQSHILAANIDASFLICTVALPETSTMFIDRFLANAEAYQVPVELIFNKIDLLSPEGLERIEELKGIYEGIGYPCHMVSATTGEGLDVLRDGMQGRVTLLSGHSGVGKSTLINALVPEANLRTSEISSAHQTGMHTTTFSQLIPLPQSDGYLIDTPGIKGFGLLEMEREEVSHYFREIFAYSSACRFGDCTHTHEPSCAVLEAVEAGEIAESRYLSYLGILEDEESDKYRPEY